MIGVVAAGGKGTRMKPVTYWINKHLIPVGKGKLMIDYPVEHLATMFMEVTVMTGCEHAGQISEYLKDGTAYGIKRINYEVQPSAAGIADVVKRVSHLIDGQNTFGMVLILGDNYFSQPQLKKVTEGDPQRAIAFEFDLGDEKSARSFGQAVRDEAGKVVDIVEKPKKPTHARVLTGLYYFPADVVSYVESLRPSQRDELEITDLLREYLEKDRLDIQEVSGYWQDLGEWDSWAEHVSNQK